MASTPYFILGPNSALSVLGLLRGPDKTVATPAEDWRTATVDVVIPALNEEATIVLCLASLAKQTLRPKRIILIDDGSTDRTLEFATRFCEMHDLALVPIRREKPIGKTPTLKRQAREFDSDVEFILDSDTVLESENYIERAVQELYQGVGIASACGTILPLRRHDRRTWAGDARVAAFLEVEPDAPVYGPTSWWSRFQLAVTALYRDTLYMYLQRFVYVGQMAFFGSITSPVGCAVAYRRKYVKELFDHYEPILGDDLTNSEDIFIGFAFLSEGYRNIQLTDVYARSQEPEVSGLPRQWYMWGSAFLQSCYYFDHLLTSPFKVWRRYKRRRALKQEKVEERRAVGEPYRQSFGRDHTAQFGRPMGWVLVMTAVEKMLFPTILVLMCTFGLWETLALTIIGETLISVSILTWVAEGHRLQYFLKGIAVVPFRYGLLFFEVFTILRFAADLWIFRFRGWRK